MSITTEIRHAVAEDFIREYSNALINRDWKKVKYMEESESNEEFFRFYICSDLDIDYLMSEARRFVKNGFKPVSKGSK